MKFAVIKISIAVLLLFLPAFVFGADVFRDGSGISEWTVVGPNGGDVRAVTIDPKNKDRLFGSTQDGQVHVSDDAGKTWRILVNLGIPLLTLDQLLVDSRDSDTLYASGHRGNFPGGFFKSVDGGSTWREAKELQGQAIHAMVQAKYDPNILLIGSRKGMWISRNSGDSWEKLESSSSPVDINSMALDPVNDKVIYAGTNWRPYKSTDGGNSWRLIKDGLIDDSDVFAITINPRNSNHIISSACSGIYESFNGGEKWAKIQGIPSQSRRTRDILQHPTLAGVVYAGTTEGFWMTTNGGKSWALTTQRTIEINSIAVHPDAPNRVFIGTNNFGVMVSNDGGKNFVPTNDGFTSRFTYSIVPDSTQRDRLYAITHNTSMTGGFFFTSSDGGKTWVQTKGLDINRVSPYALIQDRTNPNILYLGSNLGVSYSNDRGVTWSQLVPTKPVVAKKVVSRKGKPAPKPTPVATPKGYVSAIAERIRVFAHAEDEKNGVFAGTEKGLYKSYDIKKGWQKLSFGDWINPSVLSIHASSVMPGTVWVGTASSGLIVSRDDGATWSKVSGIPERVPVMSIAVDTKRPNNVYVGTSQAFYLSRDGGRTWMFRGGNLPLGSYTSILIDPKNPDELFVSSSFERDGGVFFSKDAGMRWTRLDSKDMKIPSRRIWTMAFDPNDPTQIFAGSHSSGVYRISRLATDSTRADFTQPVKEN